MRSDFLLYTENSAQILLVEFRSFLSPRDQIQLGLECIGRRGKGKAGVEIGRIGREDFSSLGI